MMLFRAVGVSCFLLSTLVVCCLLEAALASTAAGTVASETSQGSLGKKWSLYHSILSEDEDDTTWRHRGSVTLDISDGDAKKIELKLENDNDCLSESTLGEFTNSHWYKLKLVEQTDESDGTSVITTVPSCQLRRANFRDELILTFGRMGHVISMAYMPLVSPLAPLSCQDLPLPTAGPVQFKSRISYETAEPGMTLRTVLPSYQAPPGLKMITKARTVAPMATQEIDEEQGGKKSKIKPGVLFDESSDGNKGPQQPPDPADASPFGFLRKYWYILLPILIMNLMAPQQPPPQQDEPPPQQPTGAGTAPGQGRAATGGAPSPTARGTVKRRAKRED